jgi:hypothetical protein
VNAKARHVRRWHWRYTLAEAADIAKEMRMNLQGWEATIQQIVDESNQQPTEGGKHKVLIAWRAKLGKEPISLPLHQVDQIVREVRKRLTTVNR